MKTIFIHTVPNLAPNLTGGGNSPQLVENSTEPLLLRLQTWVCRLSLVNLFRWLRKLPNPRWSVGAGFLILSVYSFPLQAGIISTIAGGTGGFSGDGGPATSAQFWWPEGIAVDSTGNIYIADRANMSVRKIATNGNINTIAGTGTGWAYVNANNGGPATSAELLPEGLAIDNSGNLYIADGGNHRVYKVAGGIITTVAGNGTSGFGGDTGLATSAQLNYPNDVAVDGSGNLYIADSGNNRIRKVAGGTITTVAGSATGGFGGDTGLATSAQLSSPMGVAVDGSGNLYIADSNNHRIRKVSGGTITTIAGAGQGFSGDGGPATSAQLNIPIDVIVNSSGHLYIADRDNHSIRRIINGIITTAAGNGGSGFSGDGSSSGFAQLSQPYSVAIDGSGNLYIADGGNNRIRKVLAPLSQTINFTPPSTGTSPGSASLTATATSGLPVTFASTTTGICTVSGTTVTYIAAGTCTLTANQAGDADYLPALQVSGNVTVINNNPPTANSGTLTTNEDTVGSGTLTASDADGNALIYSIVTNGSKGSATITNANTGAYTYTPTANQNGSDSFTFKANDGLADSPPKTITVTITAVNDAPIITSQTALSVNEDTPLTLTLANLTVTDVDNPYPTGFSLLLQSGTNYTFSGNTITPAANFNGTLTVPVKVNDGGLDSNIYNLTVTVNAVNDVPVATPGSLTTLEDTVGNGTVTGTDVEGSTLTYYLVTDGNQGTAAINSTTGAYTYTPTANLNGSDSFTFKVNDGTVDSNTATVTVTITPVNDIPTFSASDPPAVLENTGTHTLTGWATFNPGPNDPDNVLAYTVSNVSNPGLFSISPSVDTSGTLTYTLAANQSGSSTFAVTVQDNGGTTNGGIDTSAPTTFTMSINAPEINLTQNTQTLLNGAGTYDFGNVLQTTSTAAITFTIDNLGTADLILGNPKLLVGGIDTSDFSLNDTTQSPIPPGGNTTFTLTFTPSTVGLRTATLTIASNDSDEGNYTIALQGTGTFSKIQATTADTAVPIANGGVYNFGNALVGSRASPVTLLLENQGTGMLFLTGTPLITIIDGDSFDFGIDASATSNGIAMNSNTRFTANFLPAVAGPRRAVVKIANNDLTQSSYIITLLGTGVEPNLQVTQGDLTLISGAPYDLGTMFVSDTTPPVSFTFANLGTAPLYLYDTPAVRLTGTYADNFMVDSSQVTNPLAPGAKLTFTLTFHPLTPGVKTAQLEIRNSDLDEGGYFIALSGLGITPEIQVLQGTTNLPNGSNYAFGGAAVGIATAPVTVTINNLGTADLTLAAESPRVKISGENRSDFSVTETSLAPVIPVGASTSFTVTFTPTTTGPKTATLTLLNNDLDEYNYTLQLTGTGQEFSCDAQGTVPLTDNKICAWSGGHATFIIDPNLPNHGDGNGDGIVDAKQTHVATLKDQVTGEYLTLEVDPSCTIAAAYTDLPEHYPGYNKKNPFPQGMTYFDLKCSQTTVSIYQHGITKLLPNLRYQKYGQQVPGDDSSIGWYRIPEAKFTKVLIGGQPVIKVTYFLKDGELGDNTGVDGHIVDPGGVVYP